MASTTSSFVKFLENNGATVHPHLDLFSLLPNGDRGLVATHPIKEGEVLLIIPKDLCIWFHKTPSSTSLPSLTVLAQTPEDERPSSFMCTVLMLMAEKILGSKSRFAPYIESLPASHDAIVGWTDDELSLLQGTSIGPNDTCTKSLNIAESVFNTSILPLVSKHPTIWPAAGATPTLFLWALGMVQSRAFHLVADNWITGTSKAGTDLYLIPGIDMLNHTADPGLRATELQMINSDSPHFTMVAQRDVAAGEGILHTYGDLSDAQTLQTFGFVEEFCRDEMPSSTKLTSNPHNTITIPTDILISICATLAGASWKDEIKGGAPDNVRARADFLQTASILQGPSFELPAAEPLTDELITAARLLLVDPKDWESVYKPRLEQNTAPIPDDEVDSEDFDGLIVFLSLLRTVMECQKVLVSQEDINKSPCSSKYRRKCAQAVVAVQRGGLAKLRESIEQAMEEPSSLDDDEPSGESSAEETPPPSKRTRKAE